MPARVVTWLRQARRGRGFQGIFPARVALLTAQPRTKNHERLAMKLDIFIRQLLAAVGGYLCIDTSNLPALAAGIAALVIACLWSFLKKANLFDSASALNDDLLVLAQKALGVAFSQGIAALSGALMNHGFTGDPNDTAAVLLFLLNTGLSHGNVHQIAVGAPLHVLALSALLSALCSCSNTARDAFTQRLEAAAVAVANETSAVALEGVLQTLRSELAALEAKPIDADPMQQLLDSSRVQALRATLKLGEERLAKLRRTKVVTEVNEVGERSRLQVSRFKSGQPINPLRGSSSGTTQSRPHPVRAVKVMVSAPPLDAEGRQAGLPQGRVTIPHLAQQVIAALQARCCEAAKQP